MFSIVTGHVTSLRLPDLREGGPGGRIGIFMWAVFSLPVAVFPIVAIGMGMEEMSSLTSPAVSRILCNN